MWALIVLGSLVLVLVVLLSLPVNLKISMNTAEKPGLSVKIVWLFGLLKTDLSKREKKDKPEEKPKKRRRFRFKTLRDLAGNTGLFKQIWLLLTRLLKVPDIRDVSAELTVGLGDPADTAFLFAVIAPITSLFSSSIGRHLFLRPSIGGEPVLKGKANATVSVQPIKTVPPFFRFIFSGPVLKAAKSMVGGRWQRS